MKKFKCENKVNIMFFLEELLFTKMTELGPYVSLLRIYLELQ